MSAVNMAEELAVARNTADGWAREIRRLHMDMRVRDRDIIYLREELERTIAERDRWRGDAKERSDIIIRLGDENAHLRDELYHLRKSIAAEAGTV